MHNKLQQKASKLKKLVSMIEAKAAQDGKIIEELRFKLGGQCVQKTMLKMIVEYINEEKSITL
jgi:hypothetical protein